MVEVNKLNKGKGSKPAPVPAAKATVATPAPKPAPKPVAPPSKPPTKPPAKPNARFSNPPARVGRETQVVTQDDVGEVNAEVEIITPQASKSLQKSAGNIRVPAFLQKATMPALAAPEVLGGYIGFADPQSKKWPQMQAAELEHGDPFVFVDQQYHQCKPLQYFLLVGDSFRTTMEGQGGDFTFVTRDLETPLREIAESIDDSTRIGKARRVSCMKAEPHYTCLVLALVNDNLVPVKADFRGTKSGAASSAILAVQSAADPEWLRLSDAHKITASFPHPWGRVWNTVTTHYKVGKASGNGFFVAKCTSKPASIKQMQMLVDHFADEEFSKKLEEAEQSYQQRLEFLDKVAANVTEGVEIDPATGEPKPF